MGWHRGGGHFKGKSKLPRVLFTSWPMDQASDDWTFINHPHRSPFIEEKMSMYVHRSHVCEIMNVCVCVPQCQCLHLLLFAQPSGAAVLRSKSKKGVSGQCDPMLLPMRQFTLIEYQWFMFSLNIFFFISKYYCQDIYFFCSNQ